MKKTTYIYSLYDNTGIRYIGKSSHPAKRLKLHLSEANNPNSKTNHRINWIRKILAQGETPNVAILEQCGENWASREKRWINFGHICGWRLTNGTDGGDGDFHLSDSAKEKISIKATERMKDPARRAALSITMKRHYLDPDVRKKWSEHQSIIMKNPHTRKKISEKAKDRYKDPLVREKNKETQKQIAADPSYRKEMSKRSQKQWSNLDNRRAKSAQTKEYMEKHPELRAILSAKAKAQWADPAFREMRRERKALRLSTIK